MAPGKAGMELVSRPLEADLEELLDKEDDCPVLATGAIKRLLPAKGADVAKRRCTGSENPDSLNRLRARVRSELATAQIQVVKALGSRAHWQEEMNLAEMRLQECSQTLASLQERLPSAESALTKCTDGLQFFIDVEFHFKKNLGGFCGPVLQAFQEAMAGVNKALTLQRREREAAEQQYASVRDSADRFAHTKSTAEKALVDADFQLRTATADVQRLQKEIADFQENEKILQSYSKLEDQVVEAGSVFEKAQLRASHAARGVAEAQAKLDDFEESRYQLSQFLAGRGAANAQGMLRTLQTVLPPSDPTTLMLVGMLNQKVGSIDFAHPTIITFQESLVRPLEVAGVKLRDGCEGAKRQQDGVEDDLARATRVLRERQEELYTARKKLGHLLSGFAG